jgi:hypothetical protein
MRMRTSWLAALAAAPALLALWLSAAPVHACGARPHSGSLCSAVSDTVEVRDAPGGRVAYAASGKVLVAGYSKDGLWARIEVPCAGFQGWIARQDLTCADLSASAQAPAKP